MKLIEILDTEPHIEEVNVDYNMSNFLELWSGFRMVNLTAVVSLFVHPTLYDWKPGIERPFTSHISVFGA